MTVRIHELNRPKQLARFRINDFHREVIAQICEFIKANLDKDLSLTVVASKAGYSKSHLSRVFRMIHGVTIQEYVTVARMDRAGELLRDTDLLVIQIMHRVGYQSSTAYTKAFMARHGRVPTLYRGTARAAAKRAAEREART